MSAPSVTRARRPFSGCRAYGNAAQTVSAGVETSVTFDTEEYDTDAYHSGSGSTFTAPVSDYYDIATRVFFDNQPGLVFAYLRKSGPVTIPGSEADGREAVSTIAISLHINVTVWLNAGETVEVRAYRETGTTFGYAASGASNAFQIKRVG